MNNDEPAFPVQDCSKWQFHGMTLRDYFAAKAIQGMLADPNIRDMEEFVKHGPRQAYAVADAMIAQRQPQSGEQK